MFQLHCGLGCPDGTCVSGTCMPPAPCNASSTCGMGRACSHNFNLGYTTCQYNLDIGKTLCLDSKGRSALRKLD